MFICLISTESGSSGSSGSSSSSGNNQNALIGGVAGVGAFGLIAVIALAVLCVKFRRAQRFTHGKEPVDLNAFQNDHLGKTNLGVSEMDSC